MDTSKKAESSHLLDDLESIRKLLQEEKLQPPLLTETVHTEGHIPLLSEVVESEPPILEPVPVPVPVPAPPQAEAEPAPPPAAQPASNADALLHLDSELRAAAQLIMQDVISDFAPHIENEIKRRLEARLERLIAASGNKA